MNTLSTKIIVSCTLIFGVLALPAAAQRTIYIDFTAGDNTRTVTQAQSKTTPWKSHPYMQNDAACNGGTVPTYTHIAGDTFVFKGNETWPFECFPVTINAGGSSNSVRDVYTVDETWFTGGAYGPPVLDLEDTVVTAGSINGWWDINVNNVTINGFSMIRARWEVGASFNRSQGISDGASNNITMSNLTFSDWSHGTFASGATDIYKFITGDTNPSVDHNQLVQDVTCDGTTTADSGTCIYYGVDYIDGLSCNSVRTCAIGKPLQVINSTCQNVPPSFDPGAHENCLEFLGRTTLATGNTITSNEEQPGAPMLLLTICADMTLSVYNNLLYDNGTSSSVNGIAFNVDDQWCTYPNANTKVYAYNNTVESGAAVPFITGRNGETATVGLIELINNHAITSNSSLHQTQGSITITTLTTTTNLKQTLAQASADSGNYTIANALAPQAASGSTVDAGTDVSATVAGTSVDINGIARAAGGDNTAYDIGAYEFDETPAGGGCIVTLSVSSLAFGNQTVDVQSAAQTVNFQNTGDAACTITSIADDSDQFATSHDCGASVAASASCTITTTFTPTSPGAKTGTITVDTAEVGDATVSLTGTGAAAAPTTIPTLPAGPIPPLISILLTCPSGNVICNITAAKKLLCECD